MIKVCATSPDPISMSRQAFLIIGPCITANYGLEIQAFSVNFETSWRSLLQLDETSRRMKKFYNYCAQSITH